MASPAASPSPLFYPEWQPQYEAALLETDDGKLPRLITAAELAILNRLHLLVGKAGYDQERIAMSDALRALRYVKSTISLFRKKMVGVRYSRERLPRSPS
jgi:hypothetical protein